MKVVVAVLQPQDLPDVLSGLADIVYELLTISEVRVHGNGQQLRKQWMGRSYLEDAPRTRIDVLVEDSVVERTVGIIATAHTGRPGDGMLMVLPAEAVLSLSALR